MTEPLLYLAGVLVILVGVVLSIGLHEVGHLVPAKLFGVRVTQYMIGFGKTVWSRTRGETEYGVKAIPLGGYISMVGMFPPAKAGRRGRLFQRPPGHVPAEQLLQQPAPVQLIEPARPERGPGSDPGGQLIRHRTRGQQATGHGRIGTQQGSR